MNMVLEALQEELISINKNKNHKIRNFEIGTKKVIEKSYTSTANSILD